jgi:hypothetical protein
MNMQIVIISTALAIVLFVCAFLGFREGLRLGMTVKQGVTPEPIKGPLQAIREHREAVHIREDAEKEAAAWQEMEQYDGWTEEERKMNNKGVVE